MDLAVLRQPTTAARSHRALSWQEIPLKADAMTDDEARQVAAAVSRLEDPWAITEVAETLQRTIPSFDWVHLIRYDGRTLAEELTVPTSTWTVEGDPYRELRLRLGLQIGGRRLQPLADDDPGRLDHRSN